MGKWTTIGATKAHPDNNDKRFAKRQMNKVETGVLDAEIKECRRLNISYAEMQMQRTLEQLNQKGGVYGMTYILERKVDGIWWEYGRYSVDSASSLMRAATAFHILLEGNTEVRFRKVNEV